MHILVTFLASEVVFAFSVVGCFFSPPVAYGDSPLPEGAKAADAATSGLPRQSADWLAMTPHPSTLRVATFPARGRQGESAPCGRALL